MDWLSLPASPTRPPAESAMLPESLRRCLLVEKMRQQRFSRFFMFLPLSLLILLLLFLFLMILLLLVLIVGVDCWWFLIAHTIGMINWCFFFTFFDDCCCFCCFYMLLQVWANSPIFVKLWQRKTWPWGEKCEGRGLVLSVWQEKHRFQTLPTTVGTSIRIIWNVQIRNMKSSKKYWYQLYIYNQIIASDRTMCCAGLGSWGNHRWP